MVHRSPLWLQEPSEHQFVAHAETSPADMKAGFEMDDQAITADSPKELGSSVPHFTCALG